MALNARVNAMDIFSTPKDGFYDTHWCELVQTRLKGAQSDCVCARRRFNVLPANDEEARKLAILPGDPRYETAAFEEHFVPFHNFPNTNTP